MGTKLYVRNLSQSISTSDLESMFETVGDVLSAQMVVDVDTGLSQGAAYVEMSSEAAAAGCIDRFHGVITGGMRMTVTEDKPHIPTIRPRPVRSAKSAAAASHKRSARRG